MKKLLRWGMVVSCATFCVFYGVARAQQRPGMPQEPLGNPATIGITPSKFELPRMSQASNAAAGNANEQCPQATAQIDWGTAPGLLRLVVEGCVAQYTVYDQEISPNIDFGSNAPKSHDSKVSGKTQQFVSPKRCRASMTAVSSLGGYMIALYSDDALACEQLRAAGVQRQSVVASGYSFVGSAEKLLSETSGTKKWFLKIMNDDEIVTIGVEEVTQEWK